MKGTALAICLLLFSTTCFSQNKRTAELKLNYAFSSTGKTNKVVFTFVPPVSIEYAQKVIKVEYKPQPDTVFHENGSQFAQFTIDSISKKPVIAIDVTLEISQFDLRTARSEQAILPADTSLEQYLHSEQFIESDSALVKSTAYRLTANTRLKTIKNIFNFTKKELKYTGFNWDEHGALFALRTKGGDCSEFSALFVALCRANNIPARRVFGFTTEYDFTPRHAWAEAYTHEYGWVRFDPTAGQAVNYDKLQNIYIQLSDTRNNPKMNNGAYYAYHYWGDPIKVKETIDISKSLPHY